MYNGKGTVLSNTVARFEMVLLLRLYASSGIRPGACKRQSTGMPRPEIILLPTLVYSLKRENKYP